MQATGRNSNKDAGKSITLETSKAVEAPLRNITKKVCYHTSLLASSSPYKIISICYFAAKIMCNAQYSTQFFLVQATGRNSDKDAGNSITLETSKGVDAPLRNITKKVFYFTSLLTSSAPYNIVFVICG